MALYAVYPILFAGFLVLLYRLSQVGRRPKGLPPGPPTIPILGNIHQIPKQYQHLQFEKWAREYGPIYSVILGTKVMIVLSSDQAIKDLLDKRSNIYSSRPEMYLGQIVSGGYRMLLMEYGPTWRMLRGIVHNSLNIKASRTYVTYQDLENKAMLMGFLEKPDDFIPHIRRFTNSLTMQMIYGIRTVSIDDPKMNQLYHGFEKFSEVLASTSAALTDVFPLLRHLPDALLPMRRYAHALHKEELALWMGHWLGFKDRLRAGQAKPCFCVDLVKAQEETGISDPMASYVSNSLLEAGSDTTAATLVGFVQALLLFPEVAAAGRAEIDRVCGDRIPDLNDLSDLPYVRGCMKESLRWMPTDVLGVPHAAIQDDEYMGYKIPRGAGVMWNVWAVANDPARHPDPRRFDPTRWAGDAQTSAQAATNADASRRDHFVFGAGRRLCQGMHIADRSLFLAISRLLWAFDFRRAVGGDGQEIVPDMADLIDGTFVQPRAFRADIRPRSAFKAECVRREWAAMRELLDDELQWKSVPEGLIWRDYEPADVQEKASK
ncbi:cytochrome P450 [Pestalotiopsis sp. NC0098]|nr:cytochrome P450 [Pestalotiopsis sp. NC0098]